MRTCTGLRVRAWWRCLRILGPARVRAALLLSALAATALTVLASVPAHADPTPAPGPTVTVPAGPNAPTPQELEQIQQILREQGEKLSPEQQQALLNAATKRLRELLPAEGGVLGVFNVTDRGGMPISAYTIQSDTGGALDWDLGLENLFAEFCFMVTKWAICFCCWLVSWALSFGLAKILMQPVLSVANSLHTRVIVEMGLPSVALAVCALLCTARIFFGNKARGWGDAALSVLLAALTTTLLVSPPQTLLGSDTGAIAAARGLALEVAGVVLDADPARTHPIGPVVPTNEASVPALVRPLTDALTDAFIVRPAMLLQYGRTFEGDCAKAYSDSKLAQLAYDRQLAARAATLKKVTGLAEYLPFGSAITSWYDTQIDMSTRWTSDHFGSPPMDAFEKKCVPGDASAAKKASLDKVGGALFLLVAALIVTILICALTGSFLVAQCRIAWDAIRGEAALVAGTIPGAGRGFLWDWCASVQRSLALMITSVLGLAVFIVVIRAVLDPVQTDWGSELTLRFLCVDLVCIAAVKKRRQLSDRTRQVAANLRTKLTGAGIGGTHGSIFTPPPPTVAKKPAVARTAVRTAVRTTMAGAALLQGNPLAAIGYAMPQSVGATALLSRLGAGGRTAGRRPRPKAASGRPAAPAGRPRSSSAVPARPRPASRAPAGPRPCPLRPRPSRQHLRQAPRPASPRRRRSGRAVSRPSRLPLPASSSCGNGSTGLPAGRRPQAGAEAGREDEEEGVGRGRERHGGPRARPGRRHRGPRRRPRPGPGRGGGPALPAAVRPGGLGRCRADHPGRSGPAVRRHR